MSATKTKERKYFGILYPERTQGRRLLKNYTLREHIGAKAYPERAAHPRTSTY